METNTNKIEGFTLKEATETLNQTISWLDQYENQTINDLFSYPRFKAFSWMLLKEDQEVLEVFYKHALMRGHKNFASLMKSDKEKLIRIINEFNDKKFRNGMNELNNSNNHEK